MDTLVVYSTLVNFTRGSKKERWKLRAASDAEWLTRCKGAAPSPRPRPLGLKPHACAAAKLYNYKL